MKNTSTISVTVNIATGNRNEGNAILTVNVSEEYLETMDPQSMDKALVGAVKSAILNYKMNNKNSQIRRFNHREIDWHGEGYYGYSEETKTWSEIAEGKVDQAESFGTKVVYVYESNVR